MKITGITVGTTLPKSNFDQTDPSKGDYIKGDRSFLTSDKTLTQEGKFADAKAVGEEIASLETKVDAQTKLDTAKEYTDTKTKNLASTSTVDTKISAHNTSTSAHSDIRDLITGLTTRLNTLANSDDTTLDQLAEIVAYIKNNKSLIDGITTSKINVSDIVDNLTTSSTSKVLSAKQGVAIKALIDALQAELDSHTHAASDITGLTATSAELNVLDGITATTTELNYVDGVTSGIQAQIDSKQATVTGAATTITGSNLTASRALISNGSGKVAVSDVTSTELGYLDGVKSNIQTQLDNKSEKTHTHSEYAPVSHDHDNATTNADGFMSLTDKSKLDNTNIAYGVCSTEAATAAKTVSISGNENWSLKVGSVVMVSFVNSNNASNVTLNINGTGAYPIWYNNEEYTSTGTAYTGYAGRVTTYMFNGTHYVWIANSYDSNTTYTNVKLGHGYATCSTAAATKAKTASLSSYTLTTGGIVAVRFTYDVPAGATLNINSKGAKAIYYRNAAITDGVIKAGDTATFIYSTYYRLISIDRWQNDIESVKAYADNAATAVKNDLLNGAGAAYDTLKELGDLIDDNADAIDALENVAAGKQNKLSGAEGQIVGFDSEGNAVAQDNPQPDWNQNDETALDYVKNRPFYGEVAEKVLVETQTFTFEEFSDSNGITGYVAMLDCRLNLSDVNRLTHVTFDGMNYELPVVDITNSLMGTTAQEGSYIYYIGNPVALSPSDDNGIPFTIAYMDLTNWGSSATMRVAVIDSTATEHEVGVSIVTEVITKLDKKYLPDQEFVITATSDSFNTISTISLSNEEILEAHYSGVENIVLYLDTFNGTSTPGITYHKMKFYLCSVADASGYNGMYEILFESSEGYKIILSESGASIKQDKHLPKGSQGQVVGFDQNGNAVAQDAPSSVPEVTTSDNGKFLRVVNGVWAASTVPNAEEVAF